MTQHKEKLAQQFRGTDPSKPFFLAISATLDDGSIEFSGEPVEGVALNPDDLTELARELADEHGCDTWIYKCTPVRRIMRGKIKIKTL